MARFHDPIKAGLAALAFVALVGIGAAAGLFVAAMADPAGAFNAFDARLLHVVGFTLAQAALSTALSVGPAIPLALALNRHPHFPGRTLLLRLFALPLALPAIVAALGVLALFGRAGLISAVSKALGFGDWTGVYGLSGIVIAHVFFNLPLATRLFMAALSAAPDNHYRLASQIGMDERSLVRFVEWPLMRSAAPQIALMVLMLCLTSFTIVLLIGGGPAATTLEVEIYQSLRFDFDPARAGVLVALQVTLTVFVALLMRSREDNGEQNASLARRPPRRLPLAVRAADAAMIVGGGLYVAGPIAAIAASGFNAEFLRLSGEVSVQRAVLTSLLLGALAGLLAVLLALAVASTRKTLASRHSGAASLVSRGALMILVVPTTALGAGWFLLANRFMDPSSVALPVVVAINAVMALPFALNVIRPQYDAGRDRYDRLAAALGVVGYDRWRLIDWPALRRPLASAFAFAFALSLGDLGVIALFGSETVQTLPWLVLARMGAYRTADAAGLALLLGLFCLALMAASDRMATENRT